MHCSIDLFTFLNRLFSPPTFLMLQKEVQFEDLSKGETCPLCREEFTEKDTIIKLGQCKGHFFHKQCEDFRTLPLSFHDHPTSHVLRSPPSPHTHKPFVHPFIHYSFIIHS